MALVEVFDREDASDPLFVGEFSFLPRVGDYLAREMGGYFRYYNVVEVWHRQDGERGAFRPCVRVEVDD